jgi:hypothetical protein
MTLPSAVNPMLNSALNTVLQQSANIKGQGQTIVATLAASSVTTDYVFWLLDQLRNVINSLNQVKDTVGLNAYATAQLPGYAGTMVNDIGATTAACQACIDWVVTNFPKDSTALFLLAETLNADGSRTPRSFTPAQTAGLRTALTSLIATIG